MYKIFNIILILQLLIAPAVFSATRQVTVYSGPHYSGYYNPRYYNNYRPNYYNPYNNQRYNYNNVNPYYRYAQPRYYGYYPPQTETYVTKYNSAGGVIGTYTLDGRRVTNPDSPGFANTYGSNTVIFSH